MEVTSGWQLRWQVPMASALKRSGPVTVKQPPLPGLYLADEAIRLREISGLCPSLGCLDGVQSFPLGLTGIGFYQMLVGIEQLQRVNAQVL